MLYLKPAGEATTAKLTGKFISELLTFIPAANTIAAPDNERLGPTPNSIPDAPLMPTSMLAVGRNRPCSKPPIKGTNSIIPVVPEGKVKNWVSNCQPNKLRNG